MTCAVYFNLDGTLTENDADFESIYGSAVEQAELTALKDSYKAYTDKFFNYFQNGWAFPRRQAILDLMDDNGLDDLGQSDTFADAWEDEEVNQTAFRADTETVLDQLSDYPLGIIANGTGRMQRMKLDDLGEDRFASIVLSSEVGIVKPNSGIFKEAQNAIDADDHIIVSHDLRRDIIPAKRAGFKTVWISSKDTENNDQLNAVVDTRVTQLSDIPAAVNELCG